MTLIVKEQIWEKIEFTEVVKWKTYYAWEYTKEELLSQKEFLEYQIKEIDTKIAFFAE